MPKLHLKRTPQDEAARQWRKQKRKENSQVGQGVNISATSSSTFTTTRKRRRTYSTTEESSRKWASSDEEPAEYVPRTTPLDQTHSPDNPGPVYDEEQRFREKMFDALEDDEHLDALEARLNDFAHVPRRWKPDHVLKPKLAYNDGYGTDNTFQLDPQDMDEEEYVEWIRLGMYRRTHAKEFAEHERNKALKAARRAAEKAQRAETKRLEKVSEEHRKRKKVEREIHRKHVAKMEYDLRWKELFRSGGGPQLNSGEAELKFSDIPWPVLVAYSEDPNRDSAGLRSVTLEDLTAKGISDFLLITPSTPTTKAHELEKKQRKEILKETFLRFHPDKFEGRFMQRINWDERDVVKEAIGHVVRALNFLMDEDG